MGEKRVGTVRILCDDLPSQEGGWVEISAYVKRKHLPYLAALSTIDQGVLGDANAAPELKLREMEKFNKLHSVFVYAWDWKDPDGTPYPEPYGNSDAFGELRQEEWLWLQGQINEIIAAEEIPKANDTPSSPGSTE